MQPWLHVPCLQPPVSEAPDDVSRSGSEGGRSSASSGESEDETSSVDTGGTIYTISINFTLSTECPEKGWCLFNKAWTLSCSYLMETLLRKINLRLASICQFLMDFRAIDGHLNKHHPFYWDTLYKLLSYILSMFAGPGLGRSSHAETQTQIRGISLETALRRKSRAGSSDSNVSTHVIEIILILTVVQ